MAQLSANSTSKIQPWCKYFINDNVCNRENCKLRLLQQDDQKYNQNHENTKLNKLQNNFDIATNPNDNKFNDIQNISNDVFKHEENQDYGNYGHYGNQGGYENDDI